MIERQTRILLPCGIGDVYWSLVKFRAFCKHHNIKLPPKVAIITTTPEAKYAGSEYRSIEFLNMVPFVEVDDPPNQEAYPTKPAPRQLTRAYYEMWHGNCTYRTNFLGYDYFLVYNCAITNGVFLEKIDSLECEWDFPLNVSEQQKDFQNECYKKYGPYVVFLWSFCGGGYSNHHVKEFHPRKIIESTNRFVRETKCTPVFVGSWWDVKHGNDYLREIIASVLGAVDLVGKTNIDQLFGVIKGSEMVVGCHCGPTIMATAFHKKTIILWAKSYPLFSKNSPLVIAPPETRGTTYWPLYTRGLTIKEFNDKMLRLYYQEAIKCICGETEVEKYEKPCYEVNQKGKLIEVGSQFGKCNHCGIVRQTDLPFNNRIEYEDYYKFYPPTTDQYEAKDWEHDFSLANIRCDNYGISSGNHRILDVGSGSGAFVHACRQHGQKAYGCEIAEYAYSRSNDFIYKQALDKINFPTDFFDLVTCHDVLEHQMNPKQMIDEMFRITSQNGRCIIDFPNYFSEAGKHHWKSDEHIWCFTAEQLESLLKESGFVLEKLQKPIESKLVFYCKKPQQNRPKILLPPGIGDSYWSIVKIQAFLKREGLSLPDVSVFYPRPRRNDGHKRSLPFLEMFPFIHNFGMVIEGKKYGKDPIWREAYLKQGRTVFRDVYGFDYLLSYNGNLRVGKRLEDIDPDLRCNWFPPMFVSLEQDNFKQECEEKYGDYLLLYFIFRNAYKNWDREFSIEKLIISINEIVEKTGLTPVFTGADWDLDDVSLNYVKDNVKGAVDLVGRTSIEQLFGLIRGAKAVLGYPSGLTIISTVLRKLTMIIWNDYYHNDFARNSCPPQTWGRTYFAENTKNLTVDYLSSWVVEKFTNKESMEEKLIEQTIDKEIDRKISPDYSFGSLVIACVLKTGNYFDERYVINLKAMLERNLTVPFDFVCLTDFSRIDGCDIIPLKNYNLFSWWSKLELFRKGLFKGVERVIYFDLDTIILSNIDDIVNLEKPFYGLRPWNKANFSKGNLASGIMSWKPGDYHFLYDWTGKSLNSFRNDQEYISGLLRHHNFEYSFLQDEIEGIYSYKRQARTGLPIGARIICFHGRPRVHEVKDPWVRKVWKK